MTILLGTGRALPAHRITNEDMAQFVDTSDEWIQSHTGVQARHFVKEETALSLSLEAAQKALDTAGVKAAELGLIICATLSADHLTPTLSCELLKALGAECPAFDMNAACTGSIYASKTASALMGERPALIVGCEVLSRYINFADRSTCVIFGDGAGAAVYAPESLGKPGAELVNVRINAYPDTKNSLYINGSNAGSDVEGYYFNNRMAERVGRSTIHMDGPEVYKFATRVLVQELKDCCGEVGLTPEDVAWFVPHQANLRIIETASKKLKIPMERFFVNIYDLGNTSAASTLIALDELVRSDKVNKGDLVALAAFGGGMTSGSLLLRY